MSSSQLQYDAIRQAITPARLTSFDAAATLQGASSHEAVELYEWNAELASALLLPLHYFEVVLRNAVHEALTQTYRESWPWDNRFVNSVPVNHGLYHPRSDIQGIRARCASTGKLIPELKFVFWEHMLTRRYDAAIWNPQFATVFPGAPVPNGVPAAARSIAADVRTVRSIRNRVAHHEPIYFRNITEVMDSIERVTAYRNTDVGDWVKKAHRVTTILGQRPVWYP
ncbi:hypothetical protein MB46_18590 [Arthrobacter alpinus]|uniref:hypothetical protein n=1 Tax=Arthrobacter alpinus TaxID=656366 RepID=UPI0005CA55CC|nr:hypothetical protein [Arthrobacter alpinus]ALV47201.1 hypothetical protein MB46_18590 [Arthrobacter alpinus]